MLRTKILSVSACLLAANAFAGYVLDDISFPENVPPEVGDLAFDDQGTLYVALRRGDVLAARPTEDPGGFQWKPFASGFHNPTGLEVVAPGHLVISQMAELTEVIDTDKDGTADEYRNLASGWGLSGNYHETNALCPDGNGGYFIAVGTASHNGPTFEHLRGPYSENGRRGRNFSSVQWKGYVLHWSEKTGLEPWCNGFRMHNGIGRAPDGDIWCGDNQGDWRGSSPLYHCRKDSFSGHPSSLVWDPRFDDLGHPLLYPRAMLDDLWNRPALHIPHKLMMRSCGEPMVIQAKGAFGPFDGQMLIPDEASKQIVRAMLEEVDGAWQGACTWFYRGGLRPSNHRLALSPDGKTLYIGQTARGWQRPDEGLQRLQYDGKIPFEVLNASLTHEGFKLTFTQPVPREKLEDPTTFSLRRLRYEYGYHYGSDEVDVHPLEVSSLELPAGDKITSMELKVNELVPDTVVEIMINGLTSDSGEKLENNVLHYTLNRLRRPKTGHRVTVAENDDRIRVEVDGHLFTELHLKGQHQPVLWPVMAPGNIRMTRDWPMKEGTPGEEHDHPHHKGLFIGHQGINDSDFWHESGPKAGRVEATRVIETRSGEDRGMIRLLNTWRSPTGSVVVAETRTLEFSATDHAHILDLEIQLHAVTGDVDLEEWKDGFVGLRTHPDLRLTAKPDKGVAKVYGQAVNSEGISGKDIWGKRADWVHYWGPVEGQQAGILFLNHPDNPVKPGQKAWWHARDYGLIAANPFAPENIGGDGPTLLRHGDSLTLRYRLVFHKGDASAQNAAEEYADYVAKPLRPRSVMPPHPGYPEDYLADNPPPPKVLAPAEKRGDIMKSAQRSRDGKAMEAPAIQTHGLVEGASVYGDRPFHFSRVPDSLRGADYLQTFNNDKKKSGANQIQVELKKATHLFLLVDTRSESSLGWLKEDFEKTPDRATVDHGFTFQVYRSRKPATAFTLGPQADDNSFYAAAALGGG